MTSPEPGSAWARHCPDAWPAEFGSGLPAGFRRFASDREAALVAGRMTEAEYTGRPAPLPRAAAAKPAAAAKRKRPAVVAKLFGYNRFLDALAGREPRLHPLAVAVWCWLWRCEREGLARCTLAKLADRFGVSRSTAQRRLAELRAAGFLKQVRKGKPGRTATVYRVLTAPKPPRGRPPTRP